MRNPCYKCEKRHQECHPECKEYADFRADCDEKMKKREQISLSTPDPSVIIKRALKARKKKCRIE